MTGGDIALISITQQFIQINLFSLHSDTSTLPHNTYIQIIFEKQISVVNTPIPVDRYLYHWYTILLGTTRALAHIGVHFTHHVFGLSTVNHRWPMKEPTRKQSYNHRWPKKEPSINHVFLLNTIALWNKSHYALVNFLYFTRVWQYASLFPSLYKKILTFSHIPCTHKVL